MVVEVREQRKIDTVQRGFLEFSGEIGCIRVCRVQMLKILK